MRVPTAIFEKLDRVMLDVISWHSCQVNSEEALRHSFYLKVAAIDLRPSLLDQHRPENLPFRATERWLLSLLVYGQVVVHDHRSSQAINEELNPIDASLVDLFCDKDLLHALFVLGKMAQVRQNVVVADLALAEVLDPKHAVLGHGERGIDLARAGPDYLVIESLFSRREAVLSLAVERLLGGRERFVRPWLILLKHIAHVLVQLSFLLFVAGMGLLCGRRAPGHVHSIGVKRQCIS